MIPDNVRDYSHPADARDPLGPLFNSPKPEFDKKLLLRNIRFENEASSANRFAQPLYFQTDRFAVISCRIPLSEPQAEKAGFEPTMPFWSIRTFQARTFSHSVISPVILFKNVVFSLSPTSFSYLRRHFPRLPAADMRASVGTLAPFGARVSHSVISPFNNIQERYCTSMGKDNKKS